MPDLCDQLKRYLDATTVAADAEPTTVDESDDDVVALLDERPARRRGRVGLLVAAMAIAVAGTIGILALRSNDESVTVDTADESELVGPGPTPAPRPSGVLGDDLAWEQGSVPDEASGFLTLLSDGKSFYWVGAGLYSSGDGQTWAEVDFGNDPLPSLIGTGMVDAVFAGQLVSTSAANTSVLVEIVGIDGSIRSTMLSPEAALDSSATVIVDINDTRATIGPHGTVVTARLAVRDFGPLIEDVLGVDADSVVAVRLVAQAEDETLEVELSSGVETIRLIDHGIEDSHDFEVAPTGTVGWHSTEGVDWAPIAAGPFAARNSVETIVTATPSGFVAIGGRGWFSPDATSWAELSDPTTQLCCEPGVAWRGQALMRNAGGGLQSVGGEGVATLPLADGEAPSRYSRSIGAGEVGIAYLVDVDPDVPTFDIVYSPDGGSWKRQPLPTGIGELYCCYFDVYGVVVGLERVGVLANGDEGLGLWLGTPSLREGQ
ncbi:MAG: hypothetical protein ACR2PK_12795 [Acidimicrobiales bacterium]